ncbi:YggS family pyridoxal phosphate-dependent enzyme [Candidatus Kirkpatrickella diaphorinae]|uniref:Pyridoxal phosphate homeostasis protein n=1 Tax=Candidatus Kirkpatrickella diaphorinae TaxID=2984322 RepID=A0ABY6GGL8_9PROT|nr:YggS family pyridoxal phosphate-dependent enzyme [Candidatus Kirkpatrickella diaphorinae]UYH50659.1 YggS family pyridoxal phosphate-dependent enzyme [Candidatus Kirkpatrickella diaphorinae]
MTGRDISETLHAIRERMRAACARAARPEGAVRLVAVSKFHPQDAVMAALEAGQFTFGENRVQEAKAKFPPLRSRFPELQLHIIGTLQTNKARDACRMADVIETLDRPALADAIARAADQAGRLPQLLVQVNVGDEPQKSGISRDAADAFIESCRQRFGTQLVGVMGIPPEKDDPTPHFTYLASLAARHDLPDVSMGMSNDFETAIHCGATLIRVGTAIFGQRASQPARHLTPDL